MQLEFCSCIFTLFGILLHYIVVFGIKVVCWYYFPFSIIGLLVRIIVQYGGNKIDARLLVCWYYFPFSITV